MKEIIVIIGEKGAGKTLLFNCLVNNLSSSWRKDNDLEKKYSPIINYKENPIIIDNCVYLLVDTPNWIISPKNLIEAGILRSTLELIEKSCLVCWVVDKKDSKETTLISKLLKKNKKKVILLVKRKKNEEEKNDFIALGVKEMFFFSHSTKSNLSLLISFISKNLSLVEKKNFFLVEKKEKPLVKIIITGLPNAGKSTLMNLILGRQRSLVTSIEGTTKEPVLAEFYLKDVDFKLIDTLGILKEEEIDKKILNNCQISLIVIDITCSISKQVLKVISLGIKKLKPSIIIVNKIDLVTNPIEKIKQLEKRLRDFSFCYLIATCFLKEKQSGLSQIIQHIGYIIKQSKKIFSRQELNNLVKKIPRIGEANIYYVKQEKRENELINCFIFFINKDPCLITLANRKYLIKQLQFFLKITRIPILIFFKKSRESWKN